MLAIAPGVDDRSWGAFWQLSCPVFKAVRERYNAQLVKAEGIPSAETAARQSDEHNALPEPTTTFQDRLA
jgi:hypothetical protein